MMESGLRLIHFIFHNTGTGCALNLKEKKNIRVNDADDNKQRRNLAKEKQNNKEKLSLELLDAKKLLFLALFIVLRALLLMLSLKFPCFACLPSHYRLYFDKTWPKSKLYLQKSLLFFECLFLLFFLICDTSGLFSIYFTLRGKS
jgi:hypothetical protein